jgi:hypothetical protein
MKHLFYILFLYSFFFFISESNAQQRVIFDADMSSDWDDIGDFAVLHGLADLGEIEIIACMTSSTNGGTPLCMSAINTYYGRPDIPCARHSNSGGVGAYPAQIASEYPHPLYNTYTDCPVAVDLYRQVLAAQPDKSVVIVTAGYLDNLHELMLSGPDQYSALTGMQLITQKVKLWACAGGGYPGPWGEFNFTVSPVAAQYVVNNWPVAMSAVGFDLGNPVMTGLYLPSTPAENPIRRVYVDIKKTESGLAPAYPHPTWTQQIMYYTLRGAEGTSTFGKVDYGHNYCQEDATNQWLTDGTDPTGDQEQLYITELQRFSTQESLEALVTNSGWPKSKGTIAPPNRPTNIRATVSGNNINLAWADNSWNETGFTIERRIDNGDFTPLATIDTDVKTYSDTKPECNYVSYRIKANNALGSSEYTYSYLYDNWTEINLAQPGTTPSPALYNYYQPQHLHWNGTGGKSHIVINNNSTHGQELTINLQVGAGNNGGAFYVYFFYQDANNWYRLSAPNGSGCKFEKSVAGTITSIGNAGETLNIVKGTRLETWKITVSPNGNLKFYCNHHPTRLRLDPDIHEALNVTDALSFTTGKIALGSDSRLPLWQDFNFELYEETDIVPEPTSPTIAIDPGSLNFGNVNVGETKTLSFVIRNTSAAFPLNVTAVQSSNAQFTKNWSDGSIAIGESQTVNVTFTPTAGGTVSGNITILSDASQPSVSCVVSGTGVSDEGPAPEPTGPVHYVKVGGSGDGSSWENAAGAVPVTFSQNDMLVFIAEGTYEITSAINANKSNIKIYGGLTGTESQSEILSATPDTAANKTVIQYTGNTDRVINATGAGFLIQGCRITGGNLTSGNGGGIFLSGAGTVRYCTVDNNKSLTNGGGIHCNSSSAVVIIENCIIANNTAGSSGGGVYMNGASIMTECIITSNKVINANSEGGGVYANTSAVIERCIIDNNTAGAETTGGKGGGVILNAAATLANSLVINNFASGQGGGVRMVGSSAGGVVSVYNSTIANNKCTVAASTEGGISMNTGRSYNIINSIVWGNTNGNDVVSDIPSGNAANGQERVLKNSLFSGAPNTNGNKNADPLFLGNGDYRLREGSPAIDAGTVTDVPEEFIVWDLTGQTRVLQSGIDMGAYEYQSQTGIDETKSSDIGIYPNPASDVIYFSKTVSEIKLFTLQGQLVLSAGNVNSLNVNSLTKGLYIVHTKDADGYRKSTKIAIR